MYSRYPPLDPARDEPPAHRLNKAEVLNLIRKTENASRADIAKLSGLSAPTVSRIVEALIDQGLVREMCAGASQGGRRPTLLKFSDQSNFIIGIDLGTTHIYGVLSDFDAKVVAEVRRPTRIAEGFAIVKQKTADVIGELIGFPLGKKKRIYGVGMAVSGPSNRTRDIVEFSPSLDFHGQLFA
jgi:DNA-binding Lrp family transcriptional regulator